jgi:uncharacterized protein (TIGR02466 family)
MKLEHHKLFETHIFVKDLPNFENENLKIKDRIYQMKKVDPVGLARSNQLGWHSNLDLLNYPELDEFKKHLDFTLAEIYTLYDYHPSFTFFIASCWGNINPPFAYNNTHTHPNCLWSGVYYIQVPKNSGKIYFVDPVKERIHLQGKFRDETSFLASPSIWYEGIPGRLIIFPSYLQHCVKQNRSNEDRISLSFNVKLLERDINSKRN